MESDPKAAYMRGKSGVLRYVIITGFAVACVAVGSLIVSLVMGCNDVRVIDTNGKPIEGAKVSSVSLSMYTGPCFTNKKGYASVPNNIQGTKWISISRSGYMSKSVGTPDLWPLIVVLKEGQDPPVLPSRLIFP